jgi:hypothetical protein
VVGALLAVSLLLAGSAAAATDDRPVRTTRLRVIPDPPLRKATSVSAGYRNYLGDRLSGSPNRLVVARTYPAARPIGVGPVRLAAFDFLSRKWQRLPTARTRPFALPDGLIAVRSPCTPIDRETEACRIEVATLRWGDDEWHRRLLPARAVPMPRSDDVEVDEGVRYIGARRGDAYVQVYRDRDERLFRVRVDGRVTPLPRISRSTLGFGEITCATRRGLDTVWATGSGGVGTSYGPIRHLDDRARRPVWRTVAGSEVAETARASAVVCGGRGPVLMDGGRTVDWDGRRWVTVVGSGTPAPPPDGFGLDPRTAPLASGGFAFQNDIDVRWLERRHWHALPPFSKPGGDQLLGMTTVGDLVVYQVGLYRTDRTQLRVAHD